MRMSVHNQIPYVEISEDRKGMFRRIICCFQSPFNKALSEQRVCIVFIDCIHMLAKYLIDVKDNLKGKVHYNPMDYSGRLSSTQRQN